MDEKIAEQPEIFLIAQSWVVDFDHLQPLLQAPIIGNDLIALGQDNRPPMSQLTLPGAMSILPTRQEFPAAMGQCLSRQVASSLKLEEYPIELFIAFVVCDATHGASTRQRRNASRERPK